jgi:hypothetical protein
MAHYRLKTELTRWKQVEGQPPEKLTYPVGSIIEPTQREFAAFGDTMERVEDSVELTPEPSRTAPEADAPYDPEAAAAAQGDQGPGSALDQPKEAVLGSGPVPAPAPPPEPPAEDEGPPHHTTRRR